MTQLHLATLFADQVARHPDAECLVDAARRLDWRAVDAEADLLARALHREGVGAGDRIAIDLPASVEWVIVLLAAARIGAVVVPLDPGLGYHELKYQLRHADVVAAVIPEQSVPFDYVELFGEFRADLPSLRLVTYVGAGTRWPDEESVPWQELLQRGASHPLPPQADDPSAPLALLYTSGTMGKPKGVVLSHRAMLASARGIARTMQADTRERILDALPPFHVYGLSVTLMALVAGATLVLDATADPAVMLRLIAAERISYLPGTPTTFELLMRTPGFTGSALGSLRGGIVGGSPVAPALIDRIREWCDAEIAYGLTEAGPAVSTTRRGDPPEKRRTTVGRPLPATEVGVVDVRSGALHAVEAVGELAVRSPSLMDGYHRMPQETARSFTADGYLLTGDLALLDEEGYIAIVARRKEVIVRAGVTITPREIEDVLETHPGVAAACAIGVADAVLGEAICACVVTVEGAVVTAEELRRFCEDLLPATRVPDQVRFFDDLPMTPSGKVKRLDLARTLSA